MPRRAFRRYKTSCVIKKRLKLLKRLDPDYLKKFINEPNRLSKRHPFDCGQTKCCVCHYEKVNGIPKARYRR